MDVRLMIGDNGNGNGNLPTRTPTDTERRAAQRKQKRHERYRRKLLRRAWEGRVRICLGPEACPWGDAEAEPRCSCKSGEPCRCERQITDKIIRDGEKRFGRVVGGLVASATLDVMRAMHAGDEAAIRDVRVKLLSVLLDDERKRISLEQGDRRLQIQETSAKPQGPTIVEYIRQRADAEDTDDTEESAS